MSPEDECNDVTYHQQQISNLYDVIRVLSNPYHCHKQRLEIYLGNPSPDADKMPFPPCSMCSVCREDKEMWLSLCIEGVQLVISDVFNTLPGGKIWKMFVMPLIHIQTHRDTQTISFVKL